MSEQNGRIHNQVAELLSAYIDDEVSAEERALVEAHLATCSTCAHDLATLRQTVVLLGRLPQVAAPRPFTLREADVMPVRPPRPVWWRRPWVQGLAATAAVLLCAVTVGGVLLWGRTGLGGAPAPIALQAPPQTEATVQMKMLAEESAAVRTITAVPAIVPTAEYSAREEASAEAGLAPEAPASEEAAEAEGLADVGEAEPPAATPPPPPPPTVGETVPAPAGQPVPKVGKITAEEMATAEALQIPPGAPTPTPEALAVAPPLLEVEDMAIEITPGVIRVSGRLPLPAGQRLTAKLWRNGRPTDWAMPEDQPATVGADGRFSLDLQTRPAAPDFDLFAVEPARYEIRIRPADRPELGEARLPFDTYGPPPAEPTEFPAGDSKEGEPTGTSEANAPTAAPSAREEVPPVATAATVAPRNTVLLIGLCGVGVVALLVAGLAGLFFFRARRW